jgi:hypothetical protein
MSSKHNPVVMYDDVLECWTAVYNGWRRPFLIVADTPSQARHGYREQRARVLYPHLHDAVELPDDILDVAPKPQPQYSRHWADDPQMWAGQMWAGAE